MTKPHCRGLYLTVDTPMMEQWEALASARKCTVQELVRRTMAGAHQPRHDALDLSDLSRDSLLIECDSYTATVAPDGRIVLEIEGARPCAEPPSKRSYLTVKQVAARLNVSVGTIGRAMKDQADPIPHLRIDRRPRFVEEDIVQWATRRECPVAQRRRERRSRPVSLFGGIP